MRVIDFPVNFRLAAALFVPLAAILYFGSAKLESSYSTYKTMNSLVEEASLIGASSDLIHTLQVERGTTAGFIGSGGERLKNEVALARVNSDANIAEFERLTSGEETDLNAQISAMQIKIKNALADLDGIRAEISALNLSGSQSFEFYTETIAKLSQLINLRTLAKDDASVAINLIAYSELLAAKELAGQERGLGAGILGAGQFNNANFTAFRSKGGAQDALINRFLDLQPSEAAELYRARFADAGKADLEAMRSQMLESGLNTDVTGIAPETWFTLATKQIEVMKGLEGEIMTRIVGDASALADKKWLEFVTLVGLTIFIFLLSSVVSFSLARTVTRPLRLLCKSMLELVDGNTEAHLIHAEGKDELGQMGTAVRAYIAKAQRDLEAQEAEQKEREQAKAQEQEALDQERAAKAAEISHAVTLLGEGLNRLAEGNLRAHISEAFHGELDELRKNFNTSISKLDQTLHSVMEDASSIDQTSKEMRHSADDLSGRTESQAATLEETAAALAEITANVNDTSNSANEAASMARSAAQDAENSGKVVHNAINAMEAIETASNEITSIISVIDEIAFQTNLLALNAGVEAARAGESGAGFAVVAEEVRELAQRSAEAAREINDLISKANGQISGGVNLVRETGDALGAIAKQVTDINTAISNIAEASNQQLTSIRGLNGAVSEIDHNTQRNAVLSEECNAMSQKLASDVVNLSTRLSEFELGGNAGIVSNTGPKAA